MSNSTLVTVEQYAKLCGVSETAIRRRLSVGSVKKATNKTAYKSALIDTAIYPPIAALKRGRKPFDPTAA